MNFLTFLAVIAIVCQSAVNAFRPITGKALRINTNLNADIIDTAVGAGSFKTLAAAVTAAGLVPTLKGPGPFTVFAPTDAAFAKLPAGTVEGLLKDIPALSKILTYHVVSGQVMASAVVKMDGQKVKTVNGAEVLITVNSNGVMIDGAKVTTTDIACDNGVIHIIDSVILPKPAFNPKEEAGVSGPFGFFDPIGLCPNNAREFTKMRESELKHGRIAMIAFLGLLAGEAFPFLFGSQISGPGIYQYQQAEGIFNAWSANVIGLTLAVEGFNIVNGWESPQETSELGAALASLKPNYVNGDLKFDPLGLKPKNPKDMKNIMTKELNNGRLAMLGVAGIIAQELVTGQSIF